MLFFKIDIPFGIKFYPLRHQEEFFQFLKKTRKFTLGENVKMGDTLGENVKMCWFSRLEIFKKFRRFKSQTVWPQTVGPNGSQTVLYRGFDRLGIDGFLEKEK